MRNKYFKKFRTPVRVDAQLTEALRNNLKMEGILMPGQWQIFVTNTKRGRCAYQSETLTVPVWTFEQRGYEYALYYACHEIAHVLAPATKGDVHGPKFMAAFKSICPQELWHYEAGYKPRLAAAAGIAKNV